MWSRVLSLGININSHKWVRAHVFYKEIMRMALNRSSFQSGFSDGTYESGCLHAVPRSNTWSWWWWFYSICRCELQSWPWQKMMSWVGLHQLVFPVWCMPTLVDRIVLLSVSLTRSFCSHKRIFSSRDVARFYGLKLPISILDFFLCQWWILWVRNSGCPFQQSILVGCLSDKLVLDYLDRHLSPRQ